MIFGIGISQKSFYGSIDLFTKMSMNSTHPFIWDTQNANVSPLFQYNHSSYTISDPFRLGVSLGWKINSKHTIELGGHYDGVSTKSFFRFSNFQETLGFNTSNLVKSSSRSQQNRFFINYEYNLFDKNKKTNLSMFGSIGLVTRAGPKEVGGVGSFGGSGVMIQDSVLYESENASFTSTFNRALQLGFGISSDIYLSKKYWFTVSFQYAHSSRYLSFDKDSFTLIYANSGDVYKYEFGQYNRAAGLYFGISRHFYFDKLFDRKKK
jgi:hypothetical protein